MKKCKLKYGGRQKAIFGVDGAITAAATLTGAAIQAAATNSAAKQQAKAITDNAKLQAESIKAQTQNANQLQTESINFTRQQNKEARAQQQEIQTTLQMLAGQQNMNDRLEEAKQQVKFGGRVKRPTLLYGGAKTPFTVTDGGGVIPLQVDSNGYGLYELYGNDHDHYHTTSNGKKKTGVGIKFANGKVIEGEGNQNTNNGEKLFVTPTDAMFISKHSLKGFNPAKAVDYGMNPVEAFAYQEQIKNDMGINSDGTKKKHSIKAMNGTNILLNTPLAIDNTAGNIGVAIAASSPVEENKVAKCGKHIKLKNGGRVKAAGGFWQNNAGATWSAAGNLVGAGVNMLGNYFAGKTMSNAYNQAGNILATAYDKMHGIDASVISRSDYAAPHTMAVIRAPHVNVNPQVERLRRNASAETDQVNRNTLSSAARQQRLAGINDRMHQRMSEVYADQYNREEQIKQANAQTITNVAEANAQRDLQANQQYTSAMLNLLQYNNNIENSKIAGKAQAQADAMTQSATIRGNNLISGANALGSAITASTQGFANSIAANQKAERDYQNVLIGADTNAAMRAVLARKDRATAEGMYNTFINSDDKTLQGYAKTLNEHFGFNGGYNGATIKDINGLQIGYKTINIPSVKMVNTGMDVKTISPLPITVRPTNKQSFNMGQTYNSPLDIEWLKLNGYIR